MGKMKMWRNKLVRWHKIALVRGYLAWGLGRATCKLLENFWTTCSKGDIFHLLGYGLVSDSLSLCLFMCVCALTCAWFFATLWTVACQAPLSMGFSRQEYWSELPFPPPGGCPHPGVESTSPVFPALAGRFFTTVPPWKPQANYQEWGLNPCRHMSFESYVQCLNHLTILVQAYPQ